jgi:hypothetical protein
MTDVFTDAFALLAAAADVKGCQTRIARLKELSEQVAAAQAKLDAAQVVHDRTATSLDEREARVTERERIVTAWEREASERGARERYPFDPNLSAGSKSWSGLVRE